MTKARTATESAKGKFNEAMMDRDPLQMSRLKPRQVSVISRRLTPIRISTAVGDESAQRSSTTRLTQSRYWNKELRVGGQVLVKVG